MILKVKESVIIELQDVCMLAVLLDNGEVRMPSIGKIVPEYVTLEKHLNYLQEWGARPEEIKFAKDMFKLAIDYFNTPGRN